MAILVAVMESVEACEALIHALATTLIKFGSLSTKAFSYKLRPLTQLENK
ncbi:hypothetical protein [Pseudomonas sp. 3A(2025)]